MFRLGRGVCHRPISSGTFPHRTYFSGTGWRPLQELGDSRLETFRRDAFAPSRPYLLPKGEFLGLPAIEKWFIKSEYYTPGKCLNHDYLSKHGSAIVPLEFTSLRTVISTKDADETFQRAEVPFSIFLEWTKYASLDTPERLYLAQASFASLPKALIEDLPTPEIVAKAGTGDIYDTNLWMGIAPTYTPLHRDPNPNLFVQLAGHKVIRMLSPEVGDRLFARVQSSIGKSGSAAFRGEDMMVGEEKELLETEVWAGDGNGGYEAHVWDGDGLFIPKGWWHSVKGVDRGVLGSVNWWFR